MRLIKKTKPPSLCNNGPTMEILYHYCDAAAFLNIVKTGKLWLTGAHNMNDHMEIEWTLRKIHDEINQSNAKSEHKDLLWKYIQQSRLNPFIASFSSERDLLSQWRAYADDGRGFAVGFHHRCLPPRMPHLISASGGMKSENLGLIKVEYEEAEQNQRVASSVALPLKEMSRLGESAGLASAPRLAALGYALKNPAFSEEREWRIVHTPISNSGDKLRRTIGDPGDISEPLFRVSRGKICMYFEYNIRKQEDNIPTIAKVVLGPKNRSSEFDLGILLKAHGFAASIERSAATYQ